MKYSLHFAPILKVFSLLHPGYIFAIVQEAVNNALKHAEAQNIAVQVKETATAIYVIIKDDGKGFDMDQVMSNYQERESWGVANIRERTQLIGAELTMKSIPGEGTHITVYVPKAIEERLKRGAPAHCLCPWICCRIITPPLLPPHLPNRHRQKTNQIPGHDGSRAEAFAGYLTGQAVQISPSHGGLKRIHPLRS